MKHAPAETYAPVAEYHRPLASTHFLPH